MPEKKDVCLGLMTWPEIADRLKECNIALIPIGQTEEHGLHATIDLDSRNAEGISIRAALAAFPEVKPVVAPTISYGYSDLPGLRDYPGVFSLRGNTLVDLCYDVAFSLVRMGFTNIIFVNGHDANPPFIMEAMRLIMKKTGAFCAMGHISELNNDYAETVLAEYNMPRDFGHACLIETSIAMSFGMDVRMDKMEGHYTKPFTGAIGNIFPGAPRGISFPAWESPDVMDKVWPANSPGPKGNPAGSTPELGEKLIEATVEPLLYLIRSLQDYKPNVKENLEFEV